MSVLPARVSPVIFGCSGLRLSADERAFFTASQPFGFILFARNIADADQLRALVAELRASVDRDAPILIDQEGGRVARLGPQLAHRLPPMAEIGALHAKMPEAGLEAAALIGSLLAHDLLRYGIDVDCVPVLDVPQSGSHNVIGDRAFAADVEIVSALGGALAKGLMEAGVLPVIKHIPGHGRATADSHIALPVVTSSRPELEACDFLPFRNLSGLPMAMTAHVVYSAIDPDRPATCSRRVIEEAIRGFIGFDGLLMSDDLSMKALDGDFTERTRMSLEAGCDVVLHCNGDAAEMRAIMDARPRFTPAGARRAAAVLARRARGGVDAAVAAARLRALLPGMAA